jgi:Zn-dependent protease with chaperone function
MSRARHTHVLPLALTLAGAGALASAAPVGAAIASFHRAAAQTVDLGGILFSYPKLNAAAWILLALATVGASAFVVALRASLRQRSAYQRLLAGLDVVGQLSDHAGTMVIAERHPEAFCAGYVRPRVYISQGALNLLSKAEVEAVLAHEHHHRRVRDPLRLAGGRILSDALFFLPAIRALFGRYSDVAELNADGAAVRSRAGGRAALASALLAFDASGAGISPERIDSLVGETAEWRRPWWRMTASLALLATVITATWAASPAASARATFDVPFLSSQPCLAMLMVIPVLGIAPIVRRRVAARRDAAVWSQ